MEELLRLLYQLQQVDSELDDLNDSGDLPKEIEGLQVQTNILTERIASENARLKEIRAARGLAGDTATDLRERVKMLNDRIRSVRNNKEYEALSHEIEAAETELGNLERSSTTSDTLEATLIRDVDQMEKQLEELQTDLNDKQSTLDSLRQANANDVSSLTKTRNGLVKKIEPSAMRKYLAIRKAYSDAVVKVRRGACSGCYRAMTPQTLVQMRKYEQMFICEHCNRILVLEEMVATTEPA